MEMKRIEHDPAKILWGVLTLIGTQRTETPHCDATV